MVKKRRTYFEEKMEDPEFRRLYLEEKRKLDLEIDGPWWKNTIIGVLAHPANIYRK
jgi:hypothetical protein